MTISSAASGQQLAGEGSAASGERAEPRSRTRSRWFDVVIAVGFLALWCTGIGIALSSGWYPYAPGAYVAAGVLCAIAIGATRRFPLAALLVVGAGCIWVSSFPMLIELQTVPVAIAAFIAISFGRHRALAAGLALGITGIIVAPLLSEVSPFGGPPVASASDPSNRLLSASIVISVVIMGWSNSALRVAVTTLRERNAELVVLRRADAARVAAEERTAIAREIHDLVAHHVAAMVIRAQAAVRVGDLRPRELTETVEWIAASGQEALESMRDVVRVLRGDDSTARTTAPFDFEPAFEAIVERVRATGISVETTIDVGRPLSAALQFAVLRVSQESVTNVMLHSDADRVTMELRSRGHVVVLRVSDDGQPSEAILSGTRRFAGEAGSGIRGMRERIEALGGTLTTGPTPPRGWRVEAILPVEWRAEP